MAQAAERYIIVGAGLAGSLLAISLARLGRTVEVYERRLDPRRKGFIGGRSINLALSIRGINALERVGLAERVLADAIPMRGRMMHGVTGGLTFQPYSKDPSDTINSVSRGGLNITLLDAAEACEGVTIRFGARCLDVDLENAAATFVDEQSGEEFTAQADALLGTDGAFSAVRGAMQKTDRFDYSQEYLEHGYKELTIPPGAGGEFAMAPHALHIWPRGGSMMIALPNQDHSFTCTLFWPYQGAHSFEAVQRREDILAFFERHYPDAVALMPTLVEDFETNPTSSLVTVRCWPWRVGRSLILGDAAHAIVPFYGQGMNCAFEDVAALADRLTASGFDIDEAFEEFQARRKPNAEAIADLALANFIEMRDKVGSRWFLLKKKGEKILHRLFPKAFLPLYNMVSFTTIPYAEAVARARGQAGTIKSALAAAAALVVLAGVLLIAMVFSGSGNG